MDLPRLAMALSPALIAIVSVLETDPQGLGDRVGPNTVFHTIV